MAVLSLGLGLGLVTTMFALLDAVKNPYVPYRDADRLYRVSWRWYPQLRIDPFDVFAAGAGSDALVRGGSPRRPVLPDGARKAARCRRLQRGRGPGSVLLRPRRPAAAGAHADATRTPGRHVAVVSDALWRRAFPGRRSLQGAPITARPAVYAVVGCHAARHELPVRRGGLDPDVRRGGAHRRGPPATSSALVKLKPGVSRAQADTELAALARQLTVRYNAVGAPFYIVLLPVRDDPMHLGDIHFAMLGRVAGRAPDRLRQPREPDAGARSREAPRGGAPPRDRGEPLGRRLADVRRVRDAHGAAASPSVSSLSLWGASILSSRVPRAGLVPRHRGSRSSRWRVFALSAVAAGGAAIVFGLLPAIRVANAVSLDEPLKDGAGTTGRLRHRYSALAVSEVALALALLMGAGLLLKVVHRLSTFDYNFPARQLLQG